MHPIPIHSPTYFYSTLSELLSAIEDCWPPTKYSTIAWSLRKFVSCFTISSFTWTSSTSSQSRNPVQLFKNPSRRTSPAEARVGWIRLNRPMLVMAATNSDSIAFSGLVWLCYCISLFFPGATGAWANLSISVSAYDSGASCHNILPQPPWETLTLRAITGYIVPLSLDRQINGRSAIDKLERRENWTWDCVRKTLWILIRKKQFTALSSELCLCYTALDRSREISLFAIWFSSSSSSFENVKTLR